MSMNSKQTGAVRTTFDQDQLSFEGDSMTMEILAGMLSRFVDHPVVDMTDLRGEYKISFPVSREAAMASMRQAGMGFGINPDPSNNSVSPAQAVSEPPNGAVFASLLKLGLKLEKRKVSYDFVVIEHVEKTPTEN